MKQESYDFSDRSVKEKSKSIHGDVFDYSEAVYVNGKTKLRLKCKKHDVWFEQTPHKHLQGKTMCPECIKEKKINTFVEKYGVENPSQNKVVNEKRRKTCRQKYGTDYVVQSDAVREKITESFVEKYGVDNPMKVSSVKEKAKQTTLDRYGVENVMQLDSVRERARITSLDKYGTSHPMQSPIIKEKIKQTNLEKYGVENPMQCEAVREKGRQTNLERYGVENPFQSEDVKNAIRQTNLLKYGVMHPAQNDEIYEKSRQTNLSRYGVENPMQSEVIREKARLSFNVTILTKYGVPSVFQSEEIREKIKQSNLSKYGTEYPSQSIEIREKICRALSSRDVQNRIYTTKLQNNTFNSSKPEEQLHSRLCEIFGPKDVKRQYNSDNRYPFNCDFYIVSRDMFIELNASWVHCCHWFDESNLNDVHIADTWRQKNTKYYDVAVHTWTVRDVKKRNIAKDNKLNYVVFWDNDLADASLWFDLGCPDGQDYNNMYTWMTTKYV